MKAAGFAAAIAERVDVEPVCSFCGAGAQAVPRLVMLGKAAICSCCVGDALAALRESVAAVATAPPQEVPVRPAPRLVATSGFTGDFCDECGCAALLRTGTCVTCQNCGANSGCG